MNHKLYFSLQEHLEWLSLQRKEIFKERQQPTSSSKWSPRLRGAKVVARVATRQVVRPMVKRDSRIQAQHGPLETVWRKREVQHCQSQVVTSDSMFSLAAVVCYSLFFWQFRVQTVATAMNATGGVDTTRTRTIFSRAPHT